MVQVFSAAEHSFLCAAGGDGHLPRASAAVAFTRRGYDMSSEQQLYNASVGRVVITKKVHITDS